MHALARPGFLIAVVAGVALLSVVPGAAGGDNNPPQTRITGGPEQGDTIKNPSPTVDFKSTEPNSTFECKLDGGGFAPCTSPLTLGPLADGRHRFSVRATDGAGNRDKSPAHVAFTVQTVAATCRGQQATIAGTHKSDTLIGTPSADVIAGIGGKDLIDGGDGDDVICGGSGADQAQGGLGNDYIQGEDGRDVLGGGGGADSIYGDDANDRLRGGTLGDLMNGGLGDDVLTGFGGRDTLVGYLGFDLCRGGPHRDRALGCERRVGIP